MRFRGHQKVIEAPDEIAELAGDWSPHNDNGYEDYDVPVSLTRDQAIEWVANIIDRTRGRELLGLFSPEMVNLLFKEQSSRWDGIAKQHVIDIGIVCKDYAHEVINHSIEPGVSRQILAHSVNPALEKARFAAHDELNKILRDLEDHAISYNHYFTDQLQLLRQKRFSVKMDELIEASKLNFKMKDDATYSLINPTTFKGKLKEALEVDMTKVSAEEALDALQAYYKVCHVSY
jgi:hypothetical protein